MFWDFIINEQMPPMMLRLQDGGQLSGKTVCSSVFEAYFLCASRAIAETFPRQSVDLRNICRLVKVTICLCKCDCIRVRVCMYAFVSKTYEKAS